ncbi:BRO family protein [Staphylococcus chromogenes]|uniref:BRO family protein n=1 Tax=Staphylococcus chromogenes TaxID=46126 RepID=UPI00288631C3|nr:BRO family protein [Staphylococcus chromogenes]MDT0739767.1 BRO family protein [Staphylococcus chromogenes]
MEELQIFKNSRFGNLEVLTIDGKQWFPATQVAETLGYSNPHKAIRDHVKEKGVTIRSVLSNGGTQNKKFIDEGNLYRLISRSKLPQAEQFEEWVFDDVLPTLRKTGTYQVPNNPMDALKLMFEATEQTKTEVEKVKADVTDLKENQRLDAGEYGFVTKAINQRVAHIKQQYALSSNKEVNRELFKDINSQVKKMTGISTRTQLKQKHFNDVLDMINNWYPQPSTMYLIRQQEMEFEEE